MPTIDSPTFTGTTTVDGFYTSNISDSGNGGAWNTIGALRQTYSNSSSTTYGYRDVYFKQADLSGGGFDVGDSLQCAWKTLNGAAALARWDIYTLAPQATSSSPFAIGHSEMNAVNLHGPLAANSAEDWYTSGQKVFGPSFVPESGDFTGMYPGAGGYDVSAGFVVLHSGSTSGATGKYVATRHPFFVGPDATQADGAAFTSMGGTNINGDNQYPDAHLLGMGTTQKGIDFSEANIISGNALNLSDAHQINWQTASLSVNNGTLTHSGAINAAEYRINGVSVLGGRKGAVANVQKSSGAMPTKAEFDVLVAQFNTLLSRMRDHGLIAA